MPWKVCSSNSSRQCVLFIAPNLTACLLASKGIVRHGLNDLPLWRHPFAVVHPQEVAKERRPPAVSQNSNLVELELRTHLLEQELFLVHCLQSWCSCHCLPCHVAQHVLPLIPHRPTIVQNHWKLRNAGRMMKMKSLRRRYLTWLTLYQMKSSVKPLLLSYWVKPVLTSQCSRRVRESHTPH